MPGSQRPARKPGPGSLAVDRTTRSSSRSPCPFYVALPLAIEPDILPPGAVKDAVRVDDVALDLRSLAASAIGVKDDRPDVFLDQPLLDLPEDLFAAGDITFDRLLLDQRVDFFVTIAVPVDARPAAVEQIEDR